MTFTTWIIPLLNHLATSPPKRPELFIVKCPRVKCKLTLIHLFAYPLLLLYIPLYKFPSILINSQFRHVHRNQGGLYHVPQLPHTAKSCCTSHFIVTLVLYYTELATWNFKGSEKPRTRIYRHKIKSPVRDLRVATRNEYKYIMFTICSSLPMITMFERPQTMQIPTVKPRIHEKKKNLLHDYLLHTSSSSTLTSSPHPYTHSPSSTTPPTPTSQGLTSYTLPHQHHTHPSQTKQT